MKKIFILSLLVLLAIPAMCFADTARAIAVGGQIESIVAIADGSSGIAAEVSQDGAINVVNRSKALGTGTDTKTNNTDELIYTGACRIQSITVSGVGAGDYVLVYDATSATGTPKFDIYVGTAVDTKSIYLGGAPMATGIYVDANDVDVFTSVVYDY